MSDARLSASFPTHPKTKKLMRRLGAAGPWALVCLFLWARMNRADGDLSGMTGAGAGGATSTCSSSRRARS